MKFNYISINNFKSIKTLEIKDIEDTLILVGKNNTGKTVVLDAFRAVTGDYIIKDSDYFNKNSIISINIELELTDEDISNLHKRGLVSKYKNFELWKSDFIKKLCVKEENNLYIVFFKCVIDRKQNFKYLNSKDENRHYIKDILPKIYYIDYKRDISSIQKDIFKFQGNNSLDDLRQNLCIIDKTRICTHCFDCIKSISKKNTADLTIHETSKLLEYKLYELNLNAFSEKVNNYMEKNGAFSYDIKYSLSYNIDDMCNVETTLYNTNNERVGSLETISTGIKSIYILSLLEAYSEDENKNPSIIIIDEPEIHLHPQLQKTASEILYNLSKKNQVMFSTHAPSMVTNFSMKQIRQIVLDDSYNTAIAENTDIDDILDDLGYAANDLMNVNFVFIVEGKQDFNRLPLLLEKYYSGIYDKDGNLKRISIITTNSCTNIKTYANLKYINKLYLKDQFLMIRDSDGKNPNMLKKQLCSYYYERGLHDKNNLPRITPENVLILKYYSFENYFLNPKVMAEIGVIQNEESFYNILYGKYRDYLYKLSGFKKIHDIRHSKIKSKQDLKNNMELIKIYVRGHNLFDIFYGKYRKQEEQLLKKYIDVAPREDFKDILSAIDSFFYFENRKKKE